MRKCHRIIPQSIKKAKGLTSVLLLKRRRSVTLEERKIKIKVRARQQQQQKTQVKME